MPATVHFPPAGVLRRHFRWYTTLRPLPFLFAISAENIALTLLLAWILNFLDPRPGRTDLPPSAPDAFAVICVFAPLIETFLFQLLPIVIIRLFRGPFWLQVAVSLLLFAGAHSGWNYHVFICAGLVGGFYFAFTFAHWRTARGLVAAYFITAASHALHNLVPFLLLLLAGSFDPHTLTRIDIAPGSQALILRDPSGHNLFAIAADSSHPRPPKPAAPPSTPS